MRRSLVFVSPVLVLAAACGGTASTTEPTTSQVAEEPVVVERDEPTPDPVSPIPAGYHNVTVMLVVPDIARALAFYQTALGAEQTELVTDPDSGAALHGEMRIGDSIVMLAPESERSRAPSSVNGTCGSLMVYVADVDAAFTRAKDAGATEVTAVADMFWGDRWGQLQDPFGHRWGLATHKYELSDEEIGRRAQAWGAAMARRRRAPRFEPGEPAASHQPEGFFTVTPSLVVGSPDDVDFYVRALGAEERTRMVDPRGHLVHAELRIGDSVVMLGGEEERDTYAKTAEHLGATPFSLMLYVEDVDATFASAVAAGATQRMAVAEMFWGDRLGTVAIPSGHVLGLATHVADVTPEEIQRRMRQHH